MLVERERAPQRQLAREHDVIPVVRLARRVLLTRGEVDAATGEAAASAPEAVGADAHSSGGVRRVVCDNTLAWKHAGTPRVTG